MGDPATKTGQAAQLAVMQKMIGMLGQAQLGGIVPMFGGQRELVQPWIKGLEKYALVTPGCSIVETAFLRSSGAASDIIGEWVAAHKGGKWEDLKDVIMDNFRGTIDKSRVWKKLKDTRQGPEEKAKVFAARLLTLAKEYWSTVAIDSDLGQGQLVEVFVDGLKDNQVARAVLEKGEEKLEGAGRPERRRGLERSRGEPDRTRPPRCVTRVAVTATYHGNAAPQ